MDIRQDVSLRDYSTMRLGGTAAYMADIHDAEQLPEALSWARERNLPILMIGGGSNIIWRDEGFNGLVLVNKIKGFEVREKDGEVELRVGAGEVWDEVVARAVEQGLSGIEALSLIPGTAGATPVQNVGAYGQEVSQTIFSVEAYDCYANEPAVIPNAHCGFGYRASRFKTEDRGRFFITHVTFRLKRDNPKPPFYSALEKYLEDHGITQFTSQVIRDAVINIRQSKLPDPAVVANNGSFFANPIVDRKHLLQLQLIDITIPFWHTEDGRIKIPAAWLLEHAGFKNFRDTETGMATWPAQPLVLVNEHAHSTEELLQFRQKILDAVHRKFEIVLDQEPELLP